MIIGISGYTYLDHGDASHMFRGSAGAGKDTVADRLAEKHRFVKVAMADPLKRICREVFDFTDEQLWGPSELRNQPDPRYPYEHAWTSSENGYHLDCVHCGLRRPCGTELPKYPPCKFLTPRHALQQLGSEWGRGCYPDVWVNYAMNASKRLLEASKVASAINLPPDVMYTARDGVVESLENTSMGEWRRDDAPSHPYSGVAISDMRFINEMNAIKNRGGKVIRVKRQFPALSGGVATHQSEKELLAVPDDAFDYVIENDGDKYKLALNVDLMMDFFSGRIRKFDPDQDNDVPPFKR